VQESFNHYRTMSLEEMKSRAAEVKTEIDTDPEADVTKLNIEIEGIKEAMENNQEKEQGDDEEVEDRNFNPITGMDVKTQVPTENVEASAEYRSAFYKTMLGKELTDVESRTFNQVQLEQRADDFNTTGNSAAVLPTETLNEVISKARKEGGLLSVVREFNLPTNISVPIGTPADKASWHTEGDEVDAEQVETTKVKFEGYEVMKVFSMSIANKRMSIDAFESYLTDELAATVIEAIEEAIVHGDGDDKPEGILEGIEWDSDNTVEFDGEYQNFTDAMAKLKRGYASNAVWAMNHATLYSKVYGLVDDNGRPLFIDDPQNESIGKILGRDVVLDDHIEDDTVLLGDFQYYGYNLPEGMMVEASRESSFRKGLIDYRAVAVADAKVLVPEAFVKLEGEDTP